MTRCLRFVRWWLAMCLVLAGSAASAAGSGHLVSVQWLQQNLSQPGLLLLDASPGPLHAKAHIAGAVHADLMTFGTHEQAPSAMQQRARNWGVSPGRKIVIYDGDGTMWAARIFFELVLLGYPADDITLLDGGLAKWISVGGAVTQAPTAAPAPGSFTARAPRDQLLARLPEVLVATGEPQRVTMVDALTPEYHFGARQYFDRGGHLPNARLLPHSDFFNEDKTFKSPAQLRQMLDHQGLTPDRAAITYCGGGVAAAVPFFAMKYLLGHRDVKLYPGSQLEWLRDERSLPMWTYDAPYLLRDIDWLNIWGQGFMRQMGMARVQILDLRPAAAYAQGHLAGAVHIAAEALRAAANDRAALTALLQPLAAGAAAGYETVVVSDLGGIQRDSALALWLLEQTLGAPVSILTASVDDWALRGLPLVKTAATAAASSPIAAVVPARRVPAERKLRAADAVTLASGATPPPNAAQGRWIHLPAATLLAREGQPKPAGELWAALHKAGVPRHTELVLTADDIGDAAVNYVLLRMMGWSALHVQGP